MMSRMERNYRIDLGMLVSLLVMVITGALQLAEVDPPLCEKAWVLKHIVSSVVFCGLVALHSARHHKQVEAKHRVMVSVLLVAFGSGLAATMSDCRLMTPLHVVSGVLLVLFALGHLRTHQKWLAHMRQHHGLRQKSKRSNTAAADTAHTTH